MEYFTAAFLPMSWRILHAVEADLATPAYARAIASSKPAPRPTTVSTRPPAVDELAVPARRAGVVDGDAREPLRVIDAFDDLARFGRLRISARGDHDADELSPFRSGTSSASIRPSAAAASSGTKGSSISGRTTCVSGSPRPHVELDDFRAVGGEHQPDVKKSPERVPFRRHTAQDRLRRFLS